MAIISSLLDLDYYKITMGQVALRFYPEVPVTYAFINRTAGVSMPDFIDLDELRDELRQVQRLRFSDAELAYLRESGHIPRGMFGEAYLAFLRGLGLPDVAVGEEEGRLKVEVSGSWPETILWETLILSVITELFGRGATAQGGVSVEEAEADGRRRLARKVELLRAETKVRFSDFGTRRRFSFRWQREVMETLARDLPEQFIGTSNVLLAKELGLRPIGTFAHEMDMILSGVYHGSEEEIRRSHRKVLEVWWEQYGEPLSTALSDTFGTEFFFRDFTPEQARNWRGLRHDSGDPVDFGERAIAFYERHGVDPRTKQIVFSDGLDVETILMLQRHFEGRIGVAFGWGTNLTNDVGFDPPSIVVKAVRSCGHPTVKLGDNLDKAIGDPEQIERFARIFGYREAPPRLGVRY